MVSDPLTDRLLGSQGDCRAADSLVFADNRRMLIACPSCATSYDVDLASLGPQGRSVRCTRCRAVWHAAPSRAEKLRAAAEALAPERAIAQPPAQDLADAGEAAAAREYAAGFEAAADRPLGAAGWSERPDSAVTAVDASFATAASEAAEVESPPIAPVDLDEGRPPIDIGAGYFGGYDAERGTDVETAAAQRLRRSRGGRSKRRPLRWPLSHLQSGILALVLLDCILVGWRSDVVRALPQTASFYATIGLPVNLRGLAFDGVATRTEQRDGVPILVVQGNIVNTSGRVVDVPHLKFLLRNAVRQEIYSWTAVPTRTMLSAGESVSFRTRLASPPLDGRDVVVRFVSRRDFIAATP